MTEKIKPLLPYLAVVAFFIAISCLYFSPILQGKELPQMDDIHTVGMAKELNDYQKETGERSMWTNSMFGGMPSFQIKGDSSTNLFWYFNRFSRLGLPFTTIAIVFLYLMGFFLLLKSLNFSNWLSVAGAVAFAFGSYNFIIIIAGHITKAYTIALMAPVIAGILYTYNKNKWAGALFTTIALGAQIAYNHVQITYYLALLLMILVIERLINAIRNKTIPDFLHRSALLVGALVLAIAPNISNLWTTSDYGKYSIRGKSELRAEDNRNSGTPQAESSGLDADYAFAWSYGKMETFTFLVPNLMGGASEAIANNPKALESIDNRMAQYVGENSQYWGAKPFTSGPVYVGAIVCFLFVLALFFYKGREKWWLVLGTILSILLSWGHNFEGFNMFMFNYFPLYNKFRTVEMALVIATVTIPILAMLGLKTVIDNPSVIRQKSGYFLGAFGIAGGFAFLFYAAPNIFFNFLSDAEMNAIASQKMAYPDQAAAYDMLMQELASARRTLLKSDALRSLIFIILSSGSLWLYATSRISAKYLVPGLIVLILIDLWDVDKRYLNNDKFVTSRQKSQEFAPSKADLEIAKDKDPFYRVFAVYRNPFTEVNTSYFHKSLGGYHGAKLQIYQDVIDHYLMNDLQLITDILRQGAQIEEVESILSEIPVTNMLNTKYIIYHPEMEPIRNPYAMGNAWFVQNVRTVTGVREELEALEEVDLRETAVVHSGFSGILQNVTIGGDGGTIELTGYSPKATMYRTNTASTQLAVFSEIYYPAGWNAYINGEKAEIFRANYILRGLVIPEGENTIEFRFEPASYKYGKMTALVSSCIILALIGLFAFFYRKRQL